MSPDISPELPSEIAAYIERLTRDYPSIRSIWLIGSRANPSEETPHDWDFFIFATPNVLNALRENTSYRHPDIDLLVVTDGDNFESPWPHPNHPTSFKRGHLFSRRSAKGIESPGWEWEEISNIEALYTAGFSFRRCKALRVWPPC